MSRLTLDGFKNFFKYYDGGTKQQEGIEELWKAMPVTLLEEEANWIDLYRTPDPVPDAPKGICTPELMQRLTQYPAKEFDSVFCNDCNRLFADTGFDKHLDAMQMLMANMMHETCNFLYMQEIASGAAYNGRTDLGNTSPGDGERYKGAGVLQLTGKFNYQQLADDINDPKVMQGVDYVSTTYPFTSARVWIEKNNLLGVCLNQGFDACCTTINGGWNGIEDRRVKYALCQREMK